MCERKRVRERKSERQGEGDKKARKWGSEIRKSERQSHDRKTDKEIKQGNGIERSLGGGVAAQEAASSDYSEGFFAALPLRLVSH